MSRRTILLWALALVVAAAIVAVHELRLARDGKLHIEIFPDTTVIRTPSGKRLVVDASSPQALEEVGDALPFFHRSIDLLAFTHLTSSRLAAAPGLLRHYKVGAVLLLNFHATSGQQELLAAMKEKRVPFFGAGQYGDIDLEDGVVIQTIAPPPGSVPATSTSFAFRIVYDNRSVLIVGDLGKQTEKALLASKMDIRASTVVDEGAASSSGLVLATAPSLVILPSPQVTTQVQRAADWYKSHGIDVDTVSGTGRKELVW